MSSADRARMLALSRPCTWPTKASVSAPRQAIEERQVLGHDADLLLDRDGIAERIQIENPARARRRLQQPGQALDRRRFAGAIGPEKAIETAARDRKVDAVDGDEIAERLPKARGFECKTHGLTPGGIV